ncbi:MAG: hypothetical protein QNK04_08745 [Myxococcota bacterium]|nr:hypothetical protein [Myxococcota bacterium]
MSTPEGDAPIRFGTNGWRGILAEDFTFPRLRRALYGVTRFFRESGGGEVVVAYDSRFLSAEMARLAAADLAGAGLVPCLSRGPLPTPAATRAVRRRRAAGAVVLTASHNAPAYHGLKVFGPFGACIDEGAAHRIEAWIEGAPRAVEAPRAADVPTARDLRGPYVRELLRRLDRDALARRRVRVVYDAMHGVGAGVLDTVLERAGVRVERLRDHPDPSFGGSAPDPSPEHLGALRRRVRGARGLALGLATDGDGDRFAAVDADGTVLSASDAVALLVDHLASGGRIRRGVAVSAATGSLVERVAAAHGLPVRREPIGFKHLSRALLEGSADVAGEESGGFALGSFGVDKDGILAACLLTEIVCLDRAPLRTRLASLRRRHGSGRCGRQAVAAAPGARERLERLVVAPPDRVDGAKVRHVEREGALRLGFDDGFLMLRVSGTEPVLRVYAEARGERGLRRRLAAGAALLGRAGGSPGSG